MTTSNDTPKPTGLALLREPFPPNQVSKLPKLVKRGDDNKGKCTPGSQFTADGYACGGWHARSIHLDYVGHAALTDRLLDTDPAWSWEPLAMSPDGLPVIDPLGGMWIKLTVCGVTRIGYGHAGSKEGGDAIKEVIGDALRNAAMRFGAALELWHKGDLHAHLDGEGDTAVNVNVLPPADAGRGPGDPFAPFSPHWRSMFRKAVEEAIDHFNRNDEMAAYEDISTMVDRYADGDAEKKMTAQMAIWGALNGSSALRSAIKRLEAEANKVVR